jgi:hypothetical protein
VGATFAQNLPFFKHEDVINHRDNTQEGRHQEGGREERQRDERIFFHFVSKK